MSEKEMFFQRDLGELSANLSGIAIKGRGKSHDLIDQAIIMLLDNHEVDLSACADETHAQEDAWCIVFLVMGTDKAGFQPMVVHKDFGQSLFAHDQLDLISTPAPLQRMCGLLGAVVLAMQGFPNGVAIKRQIIDEQPVFSAHGRRTH